jgi:bifunctional non-homologous end joining protein LigD
MEAVTAAPSIQRATLYYREGSSDKVYQCSIEPQGDLFVVNFAYGRRGSSLNTGTKTQNPVDQQTATRLFEELIREKKAKGYSEGSNGTPYQHNNNGSQFTGIVPQLLNPIEERDMRKLVTHPDYCAQEKFDGKHLLVQKQGQTIRGINRKGLVCGLPETILNSAAAIPADFILDGECVGDILYVFDILQSNGTDHRSQSYQRRLVTLINLLASAMQRHIRLVETAFTGDQKRDLFLSLLHGNREGIVFKRLDAPYTPGRPSSGGPQLKFKFVATCSAVVSKVNGKRSVELRLLNGSGWIPCGNVTIPPNLRVPAVGQVVDIRYLHAFPGSNALYQPVYLGERQDVEVHECVLSQLKYKAGD